MISSTVTRSHHHSQNDKNPNELSTVNTCIVSTLGSDNFQQEIFANEINPNNCGKLTQHTSTFSELRLLSTMSSGGIELSKSASLIPRGSSFAML